MKILQRMPPLSSELPSVHELIYCLNGEIPVEAHTACTTLRRLIVYYRYLRTEMRNTEAHSGLKGP